MKKNKKNNSGNNAPICDVWFLVRERKNFDKRFLINKVSLNLTSNYWWGLNYGLYK